MQLNLTFFIQIINIAITYWFLSRFMFKPVVAFLKARDEREEKIKNNLKEKEDKLLEMEKKKQQELVVFKLQAKREYSVLPVQVVEIPSQIPCTLDKKEIEALTEKSKEILVKRVPHVD